MISGFQMTTKGNDLTVVEWIKMAKDLRILSENHETKFIVIEGQIEEGEGEEKTIKSGIVLLNKTPFELDEVVTLMKDSEQQFKSNFINDIYHQYTTAARSACNGMSVLCVFLTN